MRRKVWIILLVLSITLSISSVLPVNAYTMSLSEDDLEKIANAKTVYVDKSFKITYEEKKLPNNCKVIGKIRCDGFYKIDIGKNKLVILDIIEDINVTDNEDHYCGFSIYYLSGGRFENASEVECLDRTLYILDKNKDYYLHYNTDTDVNVTLHNKANDSVTLKNTNKNLITKDFEKIYKFKTNSKNNETIFKESYSSEGATFRCYLVGLDKKNNSFVYSVFGDNGWGYRDSPYWRDILLKGMEYYVLLTVDTYAIPTDGTLTYISGPETKKIDKAKFKKKYKGSTYGGWDSYTYKLKPYYKTKIKVQITGKNVVVNLNGKKIKCKKKVTKTLWVEPESYGPFDTPTDLNVYVYQNGCNYYKFNEKGRNYSIKITKLKVKKRK